MRRSDEIVSAGKLLAGMLEVLVKHPPNNPKTAQAVEKLRIQLDVLGWVLNDGLPETFSEYLLGLRSRFEQLEALAGEFLKKKS